MPVLPVERQGRALRGHALEIAGERGHLAIGARLRFGIDADARGSAPRPWPLQLVCGTRGRGVPAFRHAPLTDTRPVHTVRPRSAGRPEQRSPEPALRSYRDIYVTMSQRVTLSLPPQLSRRPAPGPSRSPRPPSGSPAAPARRRTA